MSVINTNYLALVSQNNLTKSQNSLGTAIERLSSGLRINSAKDDAAGQAIANRFTANVNGLTQAARNANDGISIAQTTEGALNEINENLQRIRTLSNQAVTGTNSDTDLQSIQDEIKERLDEINRVSEQTQFNGVKVLGEANNTLKIQVGAHDGQTIDINLSKIDQESLGLAGFNVASGASAAKVGGKLTAKVGGTDTEFTFSATPATGAASKEVALPTTVANPTGVTTGTSELVTKGDSGEYYIKHTDTDKTVSFYAASFTAVAGQDNTATDPDPSNATAPTLTVVAGAKLDDAAVEAAGLAPATDKPLAAIDGALKQVDELRSHLGAIQNRFQSTIANLNNTVNNLSAARSRIEDADYAVEVSNMTRSQILQQAGTSVLAQANQVPQTVLSLLR